LYFNLSYPAVLDSVVQGFLYNSKQGKSDFWWKDAGNISFEIDLHSLALAEFLAPTLYAFDNAQVFHCTRRIAYLARGVQGFPVVASRAPKLYRRTLVTRASPPVCSKARNAVEEAMRHRRRQRELLIQFPFPIRRYSTVRDCRQ